MHAVFSLSTEGITKEIHKIKIHEIFNMRETHNHPK